MSSEVRRQRVGDQMRIELAQLLTHEAKDPRLGFVTVTEVRMSKDLRYARVYVSVLGDDEERDASLAALKRMEGFLRSQIGRRIRLRHVPELQFVLDDTLERSARIEQLLRESGVSAEEPGDPAADADDGADDGGDEGDGE